MDDEERELRKAEWIWTILMIISTGMLLLSFTGCVETKYLPTTSKTQVVEKETLVPMPVPQDSAVIQAWLECDERGRVVMRWLETERSKRARLQVSLDSMGILMAKMKTERDTLYLPSKETIRTDSIYVPVPVEKELGKWEKRWIFIGKLTASLLAAVIIYLIMKITKFYHTKI